MSGWDVAIVALAGLPLLAWLALTIPAFRRWIAGYSRFSLCSLGQHKWSMPGGWCEKCGLCDKFFGGHEGCGNTCRYWESAEGETD